MPLLKLTRADGSKVEVSPDRVKIRTGTGNKHGSTVQDGSKTYAVIETKAQIEALLKAIGR